MTNHNSEVVIIFFFFFCMIRKHVSNISYNYMNIWQLWQWWNYILMALGDTVQRFCGKIILCCLTMMERRSCGIWQ